MAFNSEDIILPQPVHGKAKSIPPTNLIYNNNPAQAPNVCFPIKVRSVERDDKSVNPKKA